MTLHREGKDIMLWSLVSTVILSGIIHYLLSACCPIIYWILQIGFLVLLGLVVQFFRVPNRTCIGESNDIMCPADGKVVVIEETTESEYFKDRRIQISIFMSPLNVHANYHPITGVVKYIKYHKGLFLVAWHPKSSTDNERSTVVVEHESGKEVLFRQVAGAVARRICFYPTEGQYVDMGSEFGFIKFGSRIDIYLPLGTKIDVAIGDVVKAKLTRIGKLN
jgi:phosphatidylserine decarboxylase